jgi:hypothetical protein
MHLGLIDGPSVPHNLISTQESPVPLPKFQMAPRLKILMASRTKKEPRYTFLVSQKFHQMNPPSRFPNRAPIKREARLQGILHISQKPHLSGSPVQESSLKVALMESLAERCPTTRALKASGVTTTPKLQTVTDILYLKLPLQVQAYSKLTYNRLLIAVSWDAS